MVNYVFFEHLYSGAERGYAIAVDMVTEADAIRRNSRERQKNCAAEMSEKQKQWADRLTKLSDEQMQAVWEYFTTEYPRACIHAQEHPQSLLGRLYKRLVGYSQKTAEEKVALAGYFRRAERNKVEIPAEIASIKEPVLTALELLVTAQAVRHLSITPETDVAEKLIWLAEKLQLPMEKRKAALKRQLAAEFPTTLEQARNQSGFTIGGFYDLLERHPELATENASAFNDYIRSMEMHRASVPDAIRLLQKSIVFLC